MHAGATRTRRIPPSHAHSTSPTQQTNPIRARTPTRPPNPANPPKRVEAIIGSGPPSSAAAGVLLAAHGAGAAVCEETPVVRDDGHCWSLLQRRREPFYVGCASACLAEGRPLPHDLKTLHERAGLESFLSVLIAAGGTVLGSLTIAATAPDAFDEAWWQPVLTMAASALLPHLRNRQVRLLLGWLGGRAVGWDGWICMGGCGVSMHVLATVLLPADTDSC